MSVYVSVCVSGVGENLLIGDPWATAINQLTLIAVTRLDSVCQAQDAALWYHLVCTNFVALLEFASPSEVTICT